MTGQSPTGPERTGTDEDGSVDLMVIEDELGTALVGPADAVEAYTRSWDEGRMVPVTSEPSGALARMIGPMFGDRVVEAVYAMTQSPLDTVAPGPSEANVTIHRMVRDPQTGRIVSNARILDPSEVIAPELVALTNPTIAAVVALEMAMSAQFDQVHAHLDRIEGKVDELLALVSAEWLGDVYGSHALLVSRIRDLADGHTLTGTDWSAVAGLGTDLEVGVERLRQYSVKQLQMLDGQAAPAKRAEQLTALLRQGRLSEGLQLLVVAQKSLLLWQKLRLENVQNSEPEHLDQTIASARGVLRQAYESDVALVQMLRRVVEQYAVLQLNEAHHLIAGRRLRPLRDELSALLDGFVQARNLQMAQWDSPENAQLAEMFDAARERTGVLVTDGRRRLARGASYLSDLIEPKDLGPEASAEAERDEV